MRALRITIWIVIALIVAVTLLVYLSSQTLQPGRGSSSEPAAVR